MHSYYILVTFLGGALVALSGAAQPAQAQTSIRFVATTGADVGDCRASPCAHIQFALDAAASGDTVQVAAGAYDEEVVIRTNNLTLQGAGAETTTIRGGAALSVVQTAIEADGVARFTIEGFTITDVGALSGTIGVFIDAVTRFGAGEFVVRRNIIRGTGIGIQLGEVSGPTVIENNVIADNRQHGIFNPGHYTVVVRNNTITGNGWVGYREQLGIGNSVIANNIVAFNGATILGNGHPTGIEVGSSTVYKVSFNNVFGNAHGDYGRFVGGSVALPYDPSPGTGELSVDPMFLDSGEGDYRLAPGSASIDAGTNDDAPSTDLDRRIRPLDGDGDGVAVVDMGAFEVGEAADVTPPHISVSGPLAVPSAGHRTLAIVVQGVVTDDAGVDLASGTFAMTDEYGELEPEGRFTIDDDGHYRFIVRVEAWRRGSDRDGRRYVITLAARDSAGNTGSGSTAVVVLHDRRP